MLFLYKIFLILGIIIFSLALILFIVVFVILPLVFMESIQVQRFFVFFNVDSPKSPDFNNPDKYGINNVKNFYIRINNLNDGQCIRNDFVYLGAWQVFPENFVKNNVTMTTNNPNQSHWPILLYLHGVACNRIKPIETYKVLRKFFIIIAIDYRDFGDSSRKSLSENDVVNDIVQVYKWIKTKTSTDIYIWGHSLGSALSTHAIKLLKNDNLIPAGLILESPFTTMREEILNHPIGKIFSWLAYFNATILDPLERNGFIFDTMTNILSVECPIMIMHAEDDSIIPYTLGKKLYERVKKNTKMSDKIVYHQFAASYGYNHLYITKDPHIPTYVEQFKELCEKYKTIPNNITV